MLIQLLSLIVGAWSRDERPPRSSRAGGRMAGRHHTATISPDLIQQLFQVKYEDDERKKAAEEAEAEGDANGSPGGGGGANIRSGAPKKLNIKEEAVVASAEVVRMFVAELVHRAAEGAMEDGEDTVDGAHLERVLPQFLLDYAS